jgi:hypothetical protein
VAAEVAGADRDSGRVKAGREVEAVAPAAEQGRVGAAGRIAAGAFGMPERPRAAAVALVGADREVAAGVAQDLGVAVQVGEVA